MIVANQTRITGRGWAMTRAGAADACCWMRDVTAASSSLPGESLPFTGNRLLQLVPPERSSGFVGLCRTLKNKKIMRAAWAIRYRSKLVRGAAFMSLERSPAMETIVAGKLVRVLKRPEGRAPGELKCGLPKTGDLVAFGRVQSPEHHNYDLAFIPHRNERQRLALKSPGRFYL